MALSTKVLDLSLIVTGMEKDGIMGKVYNTAVESFTDYQLAPITLAFITHVLTTSKYLLVVVVVVVGAANIKRGHNQAMEKRTSEPLLYRGLSYKM